MFDHILSLNLKIASLLILVISIFILFRYWNVNLSEKNSDVSNFAFFCILFTSGLDIGLIMFPLMEFHTYKGSAYYNLNPLVIEIGFWGGAVWLFYFVTTFYFAYLEPKFKIFETKVMRTLLALLMLLTCAFTAKLFVMFFKHYMPSFLVEKYPYLFHHFDIVVYTIIILGCSALSALRVKFIKILSFLSIILFGCLIVWGILLIFEYDSLTRYVDTLSHGVYGYVTNINKFVTPMNNYHQFYIYWWFSWSLMIGKFVAGFIPKGTKPYKLFCFMLIVPTIPLSLWFTVVYVFYSTNYHIPNAYLVLMSVVGVLFVVNSFDSILRVSSELIGKSYNKITYKKSLLISYVLLILFFIGYVGLTNNSEGIIKIDYTGTFSIIIIYYLVFKVAKNKIMR
ncbi:hypothetical protein UA38_12680 [Photobacterium kishitanii]|uniref:Choline transporter n=1 Tax=Photobacterium kishitanii TaxID=318456 RepID=A0AAX0YTJ0_9GAMM|nr:BCCT family transporter [Photobacterium kishitanii]KJG56830.1 hypothetical protein UA38_12680 [Photobacterium kishitanii]KJG60430.1 hypothetical protein UA42_15695 [Photobacterium kishitanii]KJG64713.1 hypothetical protein UA40_15410 [Photobacterium kishitanii]PSX18815.1 hypothetical protein C0W70_12475 [Photobacterium kishitanii]PSX25746.1 hypothetical protein C0W39_23080 [Photobacterium kishitanii]